MKNISYIAYLFIAVLVTGCDSYLDIEPEGKVIPKTLEENRGLLTKAYHAFPKHKSRLAFRADELTLDELSTDAPSYKDVYLWEDVNPDPQTAPYPWIQFYNVIFYTNYIINEGVKTMEDSAEKDQLIGEAYALRAYTYFNLVNLYGKPFDQASASSDKGVPLALKIDLEQVFEPSSVAVIYEQVLSDIEKARDLLVVEEQETGMNYRFSLLAVYAFEGRVHAYMKAWDKAVEAIDRALEIKNILTDLNFSDVQPNAYNAAESILALEDVFEAEVNNAAYVNDDLIALYDRENDLRFPLYFSSDDSGFKSNKGGDQKFKCSFRVGELYLLKAEALLELGDPDQSKKALKTLLKNRYAPDHYSSVEEQLTEADRETYSGLLFEERRKELALEGQRWFDLRRREQIEIRHAFNDVIYTLKEGDPRYTLRYPQDAKLNNPEL
ncbi:RagB/SusD family nutrient uptake outer membrane protein [Sinomicrobium weinanense]|uniref:RagB/SusD family nutrient uptake outer membrane protein n=1 Tax=Sinomicrobium weinanense TaxID=2842200 RepID=A0A926JPL6_9FLAO|nr:RagB/SusD family nutrient uptake outer membrane protein [Sinomicrobium weinanense]MBC9794999.1 RagB/SusD family nutrient uptake outer membrane protein [Sinomicrobium weinanense]MBU3125140.1 RagB/SusD family nutrient uptake outer membrane protein [Sinomicrobium weinanense]